MPFEISHTFISRSFKPTLTLSDEKAIFRVDERGTFPALFPGRVNRRARATFVHRFRVDDLNPGGEPPRPGTTPLQGGFSSETKTIPLTLRISTPDGREFTAAEITVADLLKFRDRRGNPSGSWSFSLTGESAPVLVDEDSSVFDAKGTVGVGVLETVASVSAPPLVRSVALTPAPQSFQFDLFRVGTFVAEVASPFPFPLASTWRGTMRLKDPDGVVVATKTGRKLTFEVALRTLSRSRDAAGRVRKWTLEVSTQTGSLAGGARVSATVIAAGRITVAALKSRIDAILGPRGRFVSIFGDNEGGDALGRLKISDVVSAETIDMHGLLDGVLGGVQQDGGADPANIQANTLYTIARRSENLGAKLKLEVDTLKVDSIDVVVGPGVLLGAAVPAARLAVTVSGAAKIEFAGATLATARVRGGKFDMEVGMKLGADGVPEVVTAVTKDPFDIDISKAVMAALTAFLFPVGLIAGLSASEFVEHVINGDIVDGAAELFADPTLAPTILMTLFGAQLTYKPVRFDGPDIVFDYIAPVEPEPKPTPGYQGAIGRSFTQLMPGTVSFIPRLLPDTWKADNLAKIDHIVVVMMENRSYDHVLGYRARADINDGADGLTDATVAMIEAAANGPFDVRALREAGFPKNALGLMTRLPKSVGHDLHDVDEQLSVRAVGPRPEARQFVSPKGYVDNFAPKLKGDPKGVVANDVLGFYDGKDLPFYAYLAEHYAYCDRYYCSHPGPTIPNRMYSLTGDLQRDRYGFPILDNNLGDDFHLTRAPTIYDFLTRRGLDFRVYESEPSVTMLRMFARYATDTTNIVPLSRLKADVLRGDLPEFTAIEPQMHAHPQDDDHPDADMHRGQVFLQGVYNALRSNPAVWKKTLLIITYDEHGGLYDHVVPPVADLFTSPGERVPAVARTRRTKSDAAVRAGKPTPTGAKAAATSTLLRVPYGVRVPTFVVSPWTVRGKGPSVTLDHCSILKSVLARFWGGEKPFLSDRVHASHSFNAFLTEATPRMNVPTLPKLPSLPIGERLRQTGTSRIITRPLSRQEMRDGPVDYHQLTGRWARQLGR